jgi:hypothetical protein
MARKRTDADRLFYYAVRLLEVSVDMRPYGERALNLSRHDAWDLRTELLTVINRLGELQERLIYRISEDKPRATLKPRSRRGAPAERRR